MSQSRMNEALFLALANTEEARRLLRRRPPENRGEAGLLIAPEELDATLRLIHDLTMQIAGVVWECGRALYDSRTTHMPRALRAPTYAVAIELHALTKRLGRNLRVTSSISALDALDSAVRAQRTKPEEPR